jgi:hypothetical protein
MASSGTGTFAWSWATKPEKKDPELEVHLKALIAPEIAGDPMSKQKWIRSSLRQLSKALQHQGHRVSPMSVRKVLLSQKIRLRANNKCFTGSPHPDRDKQFQYIQTQKKLFLKAGLPVISVDTKKKELIGNFKNPGRTWQQQPEMVNVHDFPQDAVGRAVPYGIYNLNHNRGYVYVGKSADTPELAVEAICASQQRFAIASWWQTAGKTAFATAKQLLILCDAGGSNSYRSRLWKQQLQKRLADQLGLCVTVCHYPTGASKWNPIEHQLFSYISITWAGKPLRSFESMLTYIRGTTTETGLLVEAQLIEREYEKGITVSDKEMETLHLKRHNTCPHWNYTIEPRRLGSDNEPGQAGSFGKNHTCLRL